MTFHISSSVSLLFQGCAGIRDVLDNLPVQRYQEEVIAQNDFMVAKEDEVIGRLASIRIEKGDTLPDIARHLDWDVSLFWGSRSAAIVGLPLGSPSWISLDWFPGY